MRKFTARLFFERPRSRAAAEELLKLALEYCTDCLTLYSERYGFDPAPALQLIEARLSVQEQDGAFTVMNRTVDALAGAMKEPVPPAAFGVYLRNLARSTATQQARRSHYRATQDLDSAPEVRSPDDNEGEISREDELQAILSRLSRQEEAVLRAYYWRDKDESQADVAAKLNMKYASFQKLLYRALSRGRKIAARLR